MAKWEKDVGIVRKVFLCHSHLIWLVPFPHTLYFAQKTFLSLVPVVFFFRNGRKKRGGRGDQWKMHGL